MVFFLHYSLSNSTMTKWSNFSQVCHFMRILAFDNFTKGVYSAFNVHILQCCLMGNLEMGPVQGGPRVLVFLYFIMTASRQSCDVILLDCRPNQNTGLLVTITLCKTYFQ